MKANKMSAMDARETLPEIPEGYRQLDSTELLQSDDLRFGQYHQTWIPIQKGSVLISCSAGNTGIAARKSDRAADPEVLELRRATTKTHAA